MDETPTENYFRAIHLIGNGYTLLLRELVTFKMQLEKLGSFQSFLDAKKSRADFDKMNKNVKLQLFPKGEEAKLNNCDITSLAFLIDKLCGFPQQIKCDVKDIKKTRDKVYHRPNTNLGDDEYLSIIYKAKGNIDKLCKYIENEAFEKEVRESFKISVEGRFIYDENIRKLLKDHEMIKEILTRIEKNGRPEQCPGDEPLTTPTSD